MWLKTKKNVKCFQCFSLNISQGKVYLKAETRGSTLSLVFSCYSTVNKRKISLLERRELNILSWINRLKIDENVFCCTSYFLVQGLLTDIRLISGGLWCFLIQINTKSSGYNICHLDYCNNCSTTLKRCQNSEKNKEKCTMIRKLTCNLAIFKDRGAYWQVEGGKSNEPWTEVKK